MASDEGRPIPAPWRPTASGIKGLEQGEQARTGSGELWANYTQFYNVMVQLETDIGTMEATDIENYAFWRHAVATNIPTLPALPVIYELADPISGGGGVVIWGEAKPGYKYSLEETGDLSQSGQWREVASFTSSFPDRVERFEHRATIDGPHRFWRVGRSKLPQ